MDNLQILEIDNNDPLLNDVESMFKNLYEYMDNTGLQMPLISGGETIWRKSIEPLIDGRFGILIGAISNKRLAGFSQGVIRYSPAYLGKLKVGFISQVFVDPSYRSLGIGKMMVKYMENWFKTKDVHSFELQVLAQNTDAILFWEKIGYESEILQFRKQL